MLVDGFPLLAADLGDIKWDAVPLHQVERVEVIKGAGSALYGTGALGGVINVLTRDPARKPGTRFRLLSGLYSPPAHRGWRWSCQTARPRSRWSASIGCRRGRRTSSS